MLIPPGELYDPLFPVPAGRSILLDDDGIATNGHGSRLLKITSEGSISVVMDANQLLPVTGFDIASSGFGRFGGQIFSLAQPTSVANPTP